MEEKKTEKKGFSRLSPLLNLCPAVLVVVLIVAMLPATSPVLGEIPELLAIHADAAKQEETEKETESQADGDFKDGVYTGTGTGYGGTITVQVTVEDGNIVSVEILSAPGETASFMRRAEGVIDLVIQNQSWEVDVVSGATYSSKGILAAIQNAITGEEVELETAPVQETEALVEETFEEPEGYKDGTYYGSARGFGGTIQVKVVISEGKIADISIVDASAETPSYMTSAKAVVNRILSAQSPNVDTVSGATYSSNGIINAVKSALRQAAGSDASEDLEENTDTPVSGGNSTNKPEKPVVQKPAVSENGYVDGVYEGTAEGFGGDITVQVTVSKGKIASIKILSAEDETPSYMKEAEAVIDRMLSAQNLDVDTVSGATYSSVGIINAVADALSKAMPEDTSSGEEKPGVEDSAADPSNGENPGTNAGTEDDDSNNGESDEEQTAGRYKDGVYTGEALCTDEDLFTYTVRANVTVESGSVTDIRVEKINDQSENPEDNDSYMDYAINGRTRSGVWYEGVVKQMLDSQSTDGVDAVSRATYSSNAIVEAVRSALKNAAAEEAPETPEGNESQEIPEEESSSQESSAEEEGGNQESSAGEESSNQESSAEEESSSQESSEADTSSSEENAKTYVDGVYTAGVPCEEEDNFSYTLGVSVTVENGVVTNIAVEKLNDLSEDPEYNDRYLNYAIKGRTYKGEQYKGVVNQIIESQSTEKIDAVSGATYSSDSIVEAVKKALENAVAEELSGKNAETSDESGNSAQESSTAEEGSSQENSQNAKVSEGQTDTENTENSPISILDHIVMVWNDLFDHETEGSLKV